MSPLRTTALVGNTATRSLLFVGDGQYPSNRNVRNSALDPPSLEDRYLKSIFWATTFFLGGYLIATVVGFATYFISEVVMWLSIFIAMPVVFCILAYSYLTKARCRAAEARAEMVRLISFWIGLSFALDAITYIGIVPMASGMNPNWHFFLDQSPWIWISYLVLIASGFAAVLAFEKRWLNSAA